MKEVIGSIPIVSIEYASMKLRHMKQAHASASRRGMCSFE